LEAGTLQVRRVLSLTTDGHVFEQTKNGKGRSIELTQSAADALRIHLQRQLKEIEALGDEYQDQGLIFPGERGQPMRPWTLTRKLQRILERVALPHIRFHDLRHTCATLLLGKGVHPKFVQELLGHDLHYPRHLFARHPSYGRPDKEGYGGRTLVVRL
jgi:integrase